MKKLFLVVTTILFLLSSNIFARGFYLGGGIGNTFYSSSLNEAIDEVSEISENSTAWKIFGGFPLANNINIEGGYRNFGKIESDLESTVFESKTTAWDVAGLLKLRASMFDIFGKAGFMFWTTEDNATGEIKESTGTDFFFGVGAGVRFSTLGIRLEWESVSIDTPDNLSMVSLSATLGF